MSGETPERRQRRHRAHVRAVGSTKDEVVDDLVDLLEMLATVEHMQDRALLDELRLKYGWRH